MKKTYILDTNVLIHDPLAISKFEDNTVIIPISVIEELDKFKTHADERGRCVRIVSRKLDDYRKQGRLNEGVKTEGGGTITVELDRPHVLPREFDFSESMDNRILNHAFWHVQNKQNDEKIILVSKDINLRLKAEAVGIISQDYESGKVNIDELYRGIQTVRVPSEAIDAFYKEHKLEAESKELNPNEIVILQSDDDPKKSAVGRVSAGNTSLIKSLSPEYSPWGIHPRNNEQRWAMELLMDDSVNLVTLLGSAGTGKTLITLACGLQKTVEENVYNKLIICRPIVPVGRDIGFIPGTKEEKLSTWMGAIYDNLEIIMDKRHHENSMEQVNYLLENEKI